MCIRDSANPVADALIDRIIGAKDLESLKAATRALDRVLLWNFNAVPLFYPDEIWAAHWNKFGRPDRLPRYGTGFPSSWWIDKELEQQLAAR